MASSPDSSSDSSDSSSDDSSDSSSLSLSLRPLRVVGQASRRSGHMRDAPFVDCNGSALLVQFEMLAVREILIRKYDTPE